MVVLALVMAVVKVKESVVGSCNESVVLGVAVPSMHGGGGVGGGGDYEGSGGEGGGEP